MTLLALEGAGSVQAAETPEYGVSALSRLRPTADVEVVVPAYNEAERLPETLTALVGMLREQAWTSRVVVVDNDSADDTAATAWAASTAEVPVCAVGCAEAGKGAAVRRGLMTSSARFVGYVDADLSTPVDTVGAAVAALEAGASAAIASRHAPGARFVSPQPLGRRLGGAAFRALTRPLVLEVADTQCGFKFFERELVQAAVSSCRVNGFAFDIELLHRVQALGGTIVELPVSWTDDPRSTFRPVRDGLTSFASAIQLRGSLR